MYQDRMAEYRKRSHILVQNIPDVLDPAQKTGTHGRISELSMHLLARAIHMGLSGDKIVVSSSMPQDFADYLRTVSGQHPDFLRAHVQEPLFTNHLLAAVDASSHRDYLLNPYIQWPSVAKFSQASGIPMAFTPAKTILSGVVVNANSKAEFRKTATQIDLPIVPHQTTVPVEDIAFLVDALHKTTDKFQGTFIQADLSGGGVGNIDIKASAGQFNSGKLGQGMDKDTVNERIGNWAKSMKEAGCQEIVVAPFIELKETHTVSGFVPKEGKPIIYGIFGQVVDPLTYDYIGFQWPIRDPFIEKYGDRMVSSTSRWLEDLQKKGYIGASDVDFLVGENPVLGEVLAASESNTRWDSFRFSLQYAAMLNGWNLRDLEGINQDTPTAIRAADHIETVYPTTTDLIKSLRREDVPLFGITSERYGAMIMVPPRIHGSHFETAVSVIAQSPQQAQTIYSRLEQTITS